jgi:hypothetical protein
LAVKKFSLIDSNPETATRRNPNGTVTTKRENAEFGDAIVRPYGKTNRKEVGRNDRLALAWGVTKRNNGDTLTV